MRTPPEPGVRLDAVPVVGQVRQAHAGRLAPDHPGVALDAVDAVEDLEDRGRQRDHPRTPLAVANPEPATRAAQSPALSSTERWAADQFASPSHLLTRHKLSVRLHSAAVVATEAIAIEKGETKWE